jgi:phosphoglycerol transferase
MKITLLNAFPNLGSTAEKEFIARCVAVLGKLGHEAMEAGTSSEIIAFDPDFVLSTHDFAAKLTDHFTIGTAWNPTVFCKNDPDRMACMRSWDLALPVSEASRRFLGDIHFPFRHKTAVSEQCFFPSAPVIDIPLPDTKSLTLAYVGVHWDRDRHEELFKALSNRVDLHVYGPAAAWSFLPNAYRGMIPFDGRSLIQTLNRHGIALALHKSTHRDEDTPSMRVFEACAAKCLVITDPMLSLRKVFVDSMDYIDASGDAEATARDIAHLVAKAQADPKATLSRIEKAHAIFSQDLSLEVLLDRLVSEAARRIAAQRPTFSASDPAVTVIVRCKAGNPEALARTFRSIERQAWTRISIRMTARTLSEECANLIESWRDTKRFLDIKLLTIAEGAAESAALWTALADMNEPYFAVLDEGCEYFKDHLSTAMDVFGTVPEAELVHCGVVDIFEQAPLPEPHFRLVGPNGAIWPENRRLAAFGVLDLEGLLGPRSPHLSNAFVARSRLLTPDILDDPRMSIAGDLYLLASLAAKGARIHFDGRGGVTRWHQADECVDRRGDIETGERERMGRRLGDRLFPDGRAGRRTFAPPAAAPAPTPQAPALPPPVPAISCTAPKKKKLLKRLFRFSHAKKKLLSL